MDDDLPANMLRLKAKAEAHGWTTGTNRVTNYGGKGIDSILLKVHRDNVRLAVLWRRKITDPPSPWAFDTCLRQRPFTKLNSREAVALIELTRDVAK